MSSLVPDTTPGRWDIWICKGATWPATTISMVRDGVTVIPVSALLKFFSPEGVLVLSISATIDGAGLMTIAGLSSAQTAALIFEYANILFTVVETGSVSTDLLAGNATVRTYGS